MAQNRHIIFNVILKGKAAELKDLPFEVQNELTDNALSIYKEMESVPCPKHGMTGRIIMVTYSDEEETNYTLLTCCEESKNLCFLLLFSHEPPVEVRALNVFDQPQ